MNKQEITQENISNFNEQLLDAIDQYKNCLPPYEVGNAMIVMAVHMLLSTAPDELLAFKTIFACIENGIGLYESENSTKDCECELSHC